MKKAYLTIDDGPSVDRKMKVDFIHQKGLQAVWFCLGREICQRPDETIYTIQKGGIIGNHSYSHPRFSEISLEECFDEILKTDRIIEDIYWEAGVERPMKAFRFPYGDRGENTEYYTRPCSPEGKIKTEKIQHFLRELGYSQPDFPNITYPYHRSFGLLNGADWYWTYECLEWSTSLEEPVFGIRTLEDVFNLMERNLPDTWEGLRWTGLNYPGSEEIVLVHDHPQTTHMFIPIIERLLSKGVVFLPIPTGCRNKRI